MDESALIQEPKRLRLNEEKDTDEDRKNLDNLPEEILQHITHTFLTSNNRCYKNKHAF